MSHNKARTEIKITVTDRNAFGGGWEELRNSEWECAGMTTRPLINFEETPLDALCSKSELQNNTFIIYAYSVE